MSWQDWLGGRRGGRAIFLRWRCDHRGEFCCEFRNFVAEYPIHAVFLKFRVYAWRYVFPPSFSRARPQNRQFLYRIVSCVDRSGSCSRLKLRQTLCDTGHTALCPVSQSKTSDSSQTHRTATRTQFHWARRRRTASMRWRTRRVLVCIDCVAKWQLMKKMMAAY